MDYNAECAEEDAAIVALYEQQMDEDLEWLAYIDYLDVRLS